MGNYSNKKKAQYALLRKQESNNTNCRCAICHNPLLIQDAKLAHNYSEKRIGNGREYYEQIYAYRVCPHCKKKIDAKTSNDEKKSDKRMKYLGLATIIWGYVLGLGYLSTFILIGTDNGKVADVISPFLGLWLFLPIPIMVISIIGVVVYACVYLPITTKLKPRDGIDFDEALRLNAVHWYTKY